MEKDLKALEKELERVSSLAETKLSYSKERIKKFKNAHLNLLNSVIDLKDKYEFAKQNREHGSHDHDIYERVENRLDVIIKTSKGEIMDGTDKERSG